MITIEKKTPRVWLPEAFDPQALPPRLWAHADKARWMLNIVLRKQAHHDVDAYGFARLSATILRRVVGRPVGRIWRSLVEIGIIETSPYLAGVRCQGYRLAGGVLEQRCRLVKLVEPGLIERVRRELTRLQQEQEASWLPIHFQLRDAQRQLSIEPGAREAIARLEPQARLCQSVLVANLERRHPSFSVSHTRRVFNGLTGLCRELRRFVRLAGEPIGGLDLRNAQPALIALLIHANGVKGMPTYKRLLAALLPAPARPCSPLPPAYLATEDRRSVAHMLTSFHSRLANASVEPGSDYELYQDLVLRGDLWIELVQLCRAGNVALPSSADDARRLVKRLLLRDVIAKRGCYPSPFEQVFAAAFPSIYRFVRWANEEYYATLVCSLQRLESWIVVENVAPKLVEHIPVITLHDAIYTRERDLPIVRGAFEETFGELGFALKLKQE